MEPIKIMPCLDMKDGRVVKGVHFVNLRDAGDPVENAEFYQKEGADELAMLDIAATVENRKTRLQWVQNVSAVIDIPLTVGGGIGSLEDMEQVFEAGGDNVSMNSAAVKNPELVHEAAQKFGATEFVDPRPYTVGKLSETFDTYPDIGVLLPAMGYKMNSFET